MNDKEKILLKFANNLKKIREGKDLSIRQLAASAGLEYSQLQRIEKGKVNFALTTLIAIAQGLDVDVSELFEKLKF
ncbi:helix-turn-helix domain-containing protein [Ferruginibacter sp. SUN106]|uniref:helix-turn-helix domain-containing protein n=1 Tax=Ferruginibacter sp. SUN106 TaxID=2978348 RepID=UPI003D35AE25